MMILDQGILTLIITLLAGWTIAFFIIFKTSQLTSRQERSPLILIMHIFLLGPVMLFYRSWKDRLSPDPLLERDLFKIRFLEGTLEAAPQVGNEIKHLIMNKNFSFFFN